MGNRKVTPPPTYRLDIDKTDGKGNSLGGCYYGDISPDSSPYYEIRDKIWESLNKCGSNLLCSNPFCVDVDGEGYVDLRERVSEICEKLRGGESESVDFEIKVHINIMRV